MAALVFILLLAVLILVHELGHFLAAKKAGIRVEEFAIGFPPRLWAKKIKGTIYSFNLLPIGGFVRLYGEDKPKGKDSFAAQPIWTRFKVISAGVLMNLLLGYLILVVYLALGNAPLATNPSHYRFWIRHAESRPIVLSLQPDSQAEEMGLRPGDIILEVNGKVFTGAEDFARFTASHPGQPIELKIRRGKEEIALKGKIGANKNKGQLGVEVSDYFLRLPYKWWAVPLMAAVDLVNLLYFVIYFVANLLLSLLGKAKPMGTVVGPVGIYLLTKQAVELGFSFVLRLAAILSINLALLNFLPLPGLDGGRALFLLIEKIKGKRVKPEIEGWLHLLGFALIILLLVALTVKDVLKLF